MTSSAMPGLRAPALRDGSLAGKPAPRPAAALATLAALALLGACGCGPGVEMVLVLRDVPPQSTTLRAMWTEVLSPDPQAVPDPLTSSQQEVPASDRQLTLVVTPGLVFDLYVHALDRHGCIVASARSAWQAPTRAERLLVDLPLGRLEAPLCPDATPVAVLLHIDGDGDGRVTVGGNSTFHAGRVYEFAIPRSYSIDLSAVADGDSRFQGWSGACQGIGPCHLIVTGPTTIFARFERSGRGGAAQAAPTPTPMGEVTALPWLELPRPAPAPPRVGLSRRPGRL